MGKTSSFQLSKWYLDCVAESGDGAIVYVAELSWNAWRLRYASKLVFLGDKVTSASSIRRCQMPETHDGRIALSLPHLGVEGVWKEAAGPIERKILESNEGEIVWTCLQPASQVTLKVNGSTELAGRGYAEQLRMSVAPWKLPLTELHWGHFVSESDNLVWIDWRGTYSWRLLVHNGREQEGKSITAREISADSDVRLTLDCGLVLRSGNLGDTIFPALAHWSEALPNSLFGVHECKWRSRGVLKEGSRAVEGWGIHEVVRWRKE